MKLHKILSLLTVFAVALFLRIYRLPETMQFIPDQGWFYLSARDMVLSGNIPLVGITTSHPWMHHGPIWTYVLGIILWIFNFDPVIPAYFIAIFGAITVGLYYFVLKKMYSEKIAMLSVIMFSAAPLIVMNARIPYHTSPIPFFVILLFFTTYQWVKGKVWAFPFILFLLGVLYNLEITTFVFAISVFLILLFGVITKKKWWVTLRDPKIILTSIIGATIPMIPFITYDIFYSGKQTVWFLIWMAYRIIKLPLSLIDKSFVSSGSNPSTLSEFFTYYMDLIFTQSVVTSAIILIFTSIGLCYILGKNKTIQKVSSKSFLKLKFPIEYVLLTLYLGIGLGGLFVHRVPIEADTLLVAPFIILLTVIVLSKLIKNNYILFTATVLIAIWNVYVLLSSNYFTTGMSINKISHTERMIAIEKIITLSNNAPYSIKGRGELSDFPVFTMPYEYLLWWKGHPISKNAEKKIIVWEENGKINVYKE